MAHYFNPEGLKQVNLLHLKEVLSNFAPVEIPVVRRKDREFEPHAVRQLRQPNHKLSDEEIHQLVEYYQAGERIKALAARFEIHEQTVKAHLRRQAVPIRPVAALTEEQIDDVVLLYRAGSSVKELGIRYAVGLDTVRRSLARRNVRMRRRGRSGRD